MTDSWKLYSMLSETEAGDYPVALAECMQDELCRNTQDGAMNCPDGAPNSDGSMNAQALSGTYLTQDVRSIQALELDSSHINPAGWDSCRPPEFYSTSSTYSSHNHVDRHSFVRNLASTSTLPPTHVTPSQSSMDHIPFPYPIRRPESLLLSPLSTPSRLRECSVSRVDQLPSSTRSEESFISISEHFLHNNHTSSHVSGFTTTLNRSSYSEEAHGRGSTREYVITPHSEIGHRVPVTFDNDDEIPDQGSLSEPEYLSGIGYVLRRVRRCPRGQGGTRQSSLATEGASRIQSLTPSISRSPILRFRCVSGVSRAHSPSSVGDSFSIGGSDDCDNLPALLGSFDGSEPDRPSSPDSSRDVDTESQVNSDDGRTRFLNPGTPIQTELPDLQSLLEMLRTEGDSRRLWVVPEVNIAPDQVDFQMSPDDDDLTGDTQRATELLDGLEEVNSLLVRRYERVRGCGHDICTVCRDFLLPPEDKECEDLEQRFDPAVAWNIHASTALPFHPPPLEPTIHAFPCTHLFHTDCLIPWLSLKTTCPTCRLDIDPHSLTLRVRGWASSPHWPHIEPRERQYVNVDILGRRIPWRRPPAASLEEWVERRESETAEQREERLKFHAGPRRHSEPPPDDSKSTHHPQRRTFSEPPSTDIYQNSYAPSLDLGVCESPEPLESLAGYFEPRARSYDVTAGGSRWTIPDEHIRHSTSRMLLGPGLPEVGLEEPLFRRSRSSMGTIPNSTTNATLRARSSASTGISSESEIAVAEHTIGLATLARTSRNDFVGRFSRLQETQENFNYTYRVQSPSISEVRYVHTAPSTPTMLPLSPTFGFET